MTALPLELLPPAGHDAYKDAESAKNHRAVWMESTAGWGNGERYVVEGGRLCVMRYGHDGGGQYAEPLCNFTAQVVEDVAHDDGENVTRQFTVVGQLETGRPLPAAQVDTPRFMGMGWVNEAWGVQAIVRAGWRTRDQLREAIQLGSAEAQSRHVYTHTGWREVDGRWTYLHAGGALGQEDVTVELDRELAHYRLPIRPQDAEGAMRASLRFLEVAPAPLHPHFSLVCTCG